MMALDEAQLLAKACSADRSQRDEAFAELTAHVTPRLLALCTGMLGNRADAADVVQDVLVLAHRALPRFRGDARFSTWVFRIAVREAIRQRARTRSMPVRQGEVSEAPEARLEARDTLRRTRAALLELPADHRVVLSLFAIEALSHAEIAEILGVPEGTIWRRLHHARKALSAKLGGGGG